MNSTQNPQYQTYIRILMLLASQADKKSIEKAISKLVDEEGGFQKHENPLKSFCSVLASDGMPFEARNARMAMMELLTDESFPLFWTECNRLKGYQELKTIAEIYYSQHPDLIPRVEEKKNLEIFAIARECDKKEMEKKGFVFITPSQFNTPLFQREFCAFLTRHKGEISCVVPHEPCEGRERLLVEGFLVEVSDGTRMQSSSVSYVDGSCVVDINPKFGATLGPFVSEEKYFELCVKKGSVF